MDSYQPKILALAGSLRTDSYNKKLVKIAIRGAEKAGAKVTYIDLKDYLLPLYNQDIEDREGLPENALKLKTLMMQHDGFLIACPEYNSSISGVLKNVIDWASRKATPEEVYLSCFINKVVVLMSASPGQYGGLRAQTHIRALFANIYSLVLPKSICIPQADAAFDDKGNLKNPKQQADTLSLGSALVEFLKRHHIAGVSENS